jgi:hypothetical protein
VARVRIAAAVSGSGAVVPGAVLGRAADDHVVVARDDVERPVLVGGLEQPLLDPGLGDLHDLAADGVQRGVAGQGPGGEAAGVDDDAGGRQLGQPVPGEGAARLLEAGHQVVEVDVHLGDREPEPPPAAVAGSGVRHGRQPRHRGPPPGQVGRVGAEQLDPLADPDAGVRLPGQLGQHLVGARRPRGDPVLGERAVGVPEGGRDRGGGLGRQVPGQHVRLVAGLGQPDRAGQPDHPGSHDDDPHPAMIVGIGG